MANKNKSITNTLKKAVGLPVMLTMDEKMFQDFCWDAVNVKCIAYKIGKDGQIVRAYPPNIPDKEIKDYKIISFR